MQYPEVSTEPATRIELSQIAAILKKAQLDADKMPEAEALRFFRLDPTGAALFRLARTRRTALYKKSSAKPSPSPQKLRDVSAEISRRKKGPFAISGGTW